MREIHFNNGYPTNEWVAVEEIKKHQLPSLVGGEIIYLPEQLRILEGRCQGAELSPRNPNIEIRERKS